MFSRRKALATLCAIPILSRTPVSAANKLEIKITEVPRKGGGPQSNGVIAGTVRGISSSDYPSHKVLIYSQTDRWYVQPYADRPFTQIDESGKWRSSTHLGDSYAAILVKSSFGNVTPATPELPNIGGDVLAIDIKEGRA